MSKEYYQQYRQDHLEQIKLRKQEYYLNNRAHILSKVASNPNRKLNNTNWRKNNKEKIKVKDREYYLENKDKVLQVNALYRKNNKDKIKDYRENNREIFNAASKTWRENNRELYLQLNRNNVKRYKKENKAKVIADVRTRECLKQNRLPSWANKEEILRIYKEKPEGHHVDHIVPLKGEFVSGLHVEYNLQYLTAEENLVKGNRFPYMDYF